MDQILSPANRSGVRQWRHRNWPRARRAALLRQLLSKPMNVSTQFTDLSHRRDSRFRNHQTIEAWSGILQHLNWILMMNIDRRNLSATRRTRFQQRAFQNRKINLITILPPESRSERNKKKRTLEIAERERESKIRIFEFIGIKLIFNFASFIRTSLVFVYWIICLYLLLMLRTPSTMAQRYGDWSKQLLGWRIM